MEIRRIHEFSRQRVLVLLGLNLITFGLYNAFWLERCARTIGRIEPEKRIGIMWALITLAIAFLRAVLDVGTLVTDDPYTYPYLDAGERLFRRCVIVLFIILCFKVRNRLNGLLRAQRGDGLRFSGLWTFLFGSFYLQYRINRLRQAYPIGHCWDCGYNLTGLSEPRCPECGSQFDPDWHGLSLASHAASTPPSLVADD